MIQKRAAAAVITLAALLVVGSATTALFAARTEEKRTAKTEVVAQEGAPGGKGANGTSGPSGVIAGDNAGAADIKTGIEVGVELGSGPKPTPKPTPAKASAPGKSLLPQQRLSPRSPRSPRSVFDSSARGQAEKTAEEEPVPNRVYTWYDGDQTMKVVLQDDLGAQSTSSNTENDEVVVVKGQESIVRKQPGEKSDLLPVFRAESGGGLMTLPGGVLLALEPSWDETQVDPFFSSKGIEEERLTELSFLDNGFMVSTDPGFPSLDLANDLAREDGVVSSVPNWSRERETR